MNVLVVTLAVIIGYSSFTLVRRAILLRQELQGTEKKLEELKSKENALEASLTELKNPEAIERKAKADLNLKLPGEEVVVIVPQKAESSATSSGTFWEKVFKFLK